MKTRARSPMSRITEDYDYKRAPTIPDPELLAGWVASYRAGADIYRKPIIHAHLHIAASLARDIAKLSKRWHMVDELVAEALLHLTQAVADAPEVLRDDNITPYITTTIRHRLKDFVCKDRTVFMPGRTFRHKVAKGEIGGEAPLSRATLSVMHVEALIVEDWNHDDDEEGHLRFPSGYHIPEAEGPETSVEFEEALTLAIQTDEERRLIDLRLEGYKFRDMESALGLKKSRASEILGGIRARFNQNYA